MTVTRDEIMAQLARLARPRDARLLSKVDDATPLFNSVVMVELIMWLERRLDSRMLAAEMSLTDLDSVGQILAFVANRSR